MLVLMTTTPLNSWEATEVSGNHSGPVVSPSDAGGTCPRVRQMADAIVI